MTTTTAVSEETVIQAFIDCRTSRIQIDGYFYITCGKFLHKLENGSQQYTTVEWGELVELVETDQNVREQLELI